MYKQFFIVYDYDNEGVVWQDPTTLSVFVTWFNKLSSDTVKLPNPTSSPYVLEAAAGNNKGEIAFIVGKRYPGATKTTPSSLKGFKVDKNGKILVEKDYDTTNNKEYEEYKPFNIFENFRSGASMVWNTETNEIGFIIAKKALRGNDGLNHQAGIAVVLNADDMTVIANKGQTSGHSFANSLQVGANGKFFGADLGDNFPRGINIQEFDSEKKKSKLVYRFKTRHATKPTYTSAVYEEISTNEKTYYKQSNDNNVYTEIAHNAAIEVNNASAVLVIFAGEKPSLDNSMVGSPHNAPRNIGFVKVPRDMEDSSVLSQGPVEEGGFYNFGGKWTPQKNEGVNWLTGWTNKEEDNASRLKAVKIGNSEGSMILVFFEKWTPKSYVSTHLMGLNEDGEITHPLATSSYNFRIPFADEVRATTDGTAVFYSGDGKNLVRYEIGRPAVKVPQDFIYSSGESQDFNGTTLISVPSTDALTLQNEYTIMVWVYPTVRTNGWARIIGKGSGKNHRNYGLWVSDQGAAISQSYCLKRGINCWRNKNNEVPEKKWSHIVGVFKKDSFHRLYLNGELIKSVETSGTPCKSTEPVTIGKASRNQHTGFIGKIYKAEIYNYAMDAEAISSIARKAPPTSTSTSKKTKAQLEKDFNGKNLVPWQNVQS